MTLPAQITRLRHLLAQELSQDTPDVNAVNLLRKDLGRLENREKRIKTKNIPK